MTFGPKHWMQVVRHARVHLVEPPSNANLGHTILIELQGGESVEGRQEFESPLRGIKTIALLDRETLRSLRRQLDALELEESGGSP